MLHRLNSKFKSEDIIVEQPPETLMNHQSHVTVRHLNAVINVALWKKRKFSRFEDHGNIVDLFPNHYNGRIAIALQSKKRADITLEHLYGKESKADYVSLRSQELKGTLRARSAAFHNLIQQKGRTTHIKHKSVAIVVIGMASQQSSRNNEASLTVLYLQVG
ncbi:hypothetical protein BDF20DRAFT_832957 [Mycotypha africana]|uniref:uncharacterized protein n=1 Tax=Mycotypha africana TaxID=64632 RepID=UPI002300263E|nr:uncharacterized protein BDF20DRAFT_832957 [Mycotypha africana]KAI8988076.1 hypothetical protein BDF20DRAFT_832957 [Mycotypha africana]